MRLLRFAVSWKSRESAPGSDIAYTDLAITASSQRLPADQIHLVDRGDLVLGVRHVGGVLLLDPDVIARAGNVDACTVCDGDGEVRPVDEGVVGGAEARRARRVRGDDRVCHGALDLVSPGPVGSNQHAVEPTRRGRAGDAWGKNLGRRVLRLDSGKPSRALNLAPRRQHRRRSGVHMKVDLMDVADAAGRRAVPGTGNVEVAGRDACEATDRAGWAVDDVDPVDRHR